MTEIYKASEELLRRTNISQKEYERLYEYSIEKPESFWEEQTERLTWVKKPTIIKNTQFTSPVSIKWYEDGILNACYNCVDRHLADRAQSTALIFEGNDANESYKISYEELKNEVCKTANALKERGVKKGDRVTIYMPMVPEAVYAMLACARLSLIHI